VVHLLVGLGWSQVSVCGKHPSEVTCLGMFGVFLVHRHRSLEATMRSEINLHRSFVLIILGIASGLAALLIKRLDYALSIAFIWIALVVIVVFPEWKLGVVLAVLLGAPPFIDYELAWTAITAWRSRSHGAIRLDITQPILCAFDLCIMLAAVASIYQRRASENTRATHLPLWYTIGLLLLSCLRLVSSANAIIHYPQFSQTAWSGITSILRVPLVTLVTATCLSSGRGVRSTEVGLSVGVILFVAQSLYVSAVKHGGLTFGYIQLTGLVPGPGATGALMVLVVPILVSGALIAADYRHRSIMIVASIAGLGLALLTYSRNVIAGAMVSALVLYIGSRQSGFHMPRKVVAGFVLAIVAASRIASDWVMTKFRATFSADLGSRINLGARYAIWGLACTLIKANWLLGHGTNMWGIIAPGSAKNVHNAFLQFAIENGVPALILFISLVALACVHGFSDLRQTEFACTNELAAFKLGALSGLIGYCTSQLVSSSLGHVRVNPVFWIAVAALLAPQYKTGEEVDSIGRR
jgi:hypothetical protein